MNATKKAAEKLNENLLDMFYATDVGFRVSRSVDETGQESCLIKLDHRDPCDEVIESHGIKILIDPASAASLRDRELDYRDDFSGGFLFKEPKRRWIAEKSEALFNRFLVTANDIIILSTSFMDRIVLIWH